MDKKVKRSNYTLQSHPEVIEAGKKALETHGAGLSSVRFICGTMVRASFLYTCSFCQYKQILVH